VMVNWEFFDNQTPSSAKGLVDKLQSGQPVAPTRGARSVCSFKQMSRVLAGFHDGRADEGVGAGPATLQGTLLARREGWTAPEGPQQRRTEAAKTDPDATARRPIGTILPASGTSTPKQEG